MLNRTFVLISWQSRGRRGPSSLERWTFWLLWGGAVLGGLMVWTQHEGWLGLSGAGLFVGPALIAPLALTLAVNFARKALIWLAG